MTKILLLKELLKEVREETTDKECTAVNSSIVDCCTYLIENLEEVAHEHIERRLEA